MPPSPPSPSAPFDKTANITFSLNADDENVSVILLPWGREVGSQGCSSPAFPPLYPQPNAHLLEICYKDRIQQFDEEEEEEEEGQGSGESDGEDGSWRGPLSRGARLGQPPGVR